MAELSTIQEINRKVADQLVEEVRRNPHSPNAGKKVGIVNGQAVVVANDWREVARHVRQAEQDSSKTFCIDLGADYETVQEIWEVLGCTTSTARVTTVLTK